MKNKILVLFSHQVEVDVSSDDFFRMIETRFGGTNNKKTTSLNEKYKYKISNEEISFSKKSDFLDLSDPLHMIFTEIRCIVQELDANKSKLMFKIGFSFELIIVNLMAILILISLTIMFDVRIIVAPIAISLILFFYSFLAKSDLKKFIKEVCS